MDVTMESKTATIEGARFHALWLRDNCPCNECRHESGQRLLDTRSLPDDLAIVAVDGCTVSFSDGHVSSFDAGWLQANAGEAPPSPRTLWGAELQDELPAARYDDVTAGGPALRDWLAAVDELGFAILTGGPTEPGTVTRVAELFGFVRETNYGRLFDVRTVVNPTNLAYTGLGLGAHTDNPHREPTSTLQLLLCLTSRADGCVNTLVDAFRVAQDLPRDDFELLARTPIRFRYADSETDLDADGRVI